jgi:hypothetical protein
MLMFLERFFGAGGFGLNHHWNGIDVLTVLECALLATLICLIVSVSPRVRRRFRIAAIIASLGFATAAYAANTALSALSAAGAIADANLFYVVQTGGVGGVKATAAQVKTYANTSAVRATTTTSEALANSDQNKLVTFSNASAVAATIAQAGSGGNFAAGWVVSLKNLGAGTVTLTPTTSTIDGAATLILLPGQGCDVYSNGTAYLSQCGRGTIVAKGTLALATSAISSAACTSAQTLTATGVVTTDIVLASFNGDPTAVTGYVPLTAGMLTIIVYPTANTINVKVCNNTSASITPGAITLNLSAVR